MPPIPCATLSSDPASGPKRWLSSGNGLANLALAIPVRPNPGGSEDGQPIAHVDAVDLPSDLW
eukprot:CAMPEP_0174750110 /NCGR_PEP_ID=MMETSP1094-20130205/97047_1 /TAXON_ID=156173 /ORGANISM="Chrysochromulina brevifilum, Strain UTEX LB 985" /LENGTH=62 /DNA_ID=CAMNT_0015955409 /DNA_START=63 /DNA_END=251 /DNA_ORIENTATION=+